MRPPDSELPMPNGWFHIGYVGDVAPDATKQLAYFGRRLRLVHRSQNDFELTADDEREPWPVEARGPLLFAYRDAKGREPAWQLPRFQALESPRWSEPRVHARRIRTHPQEIAENTVDLQHLPFLHGMATRGEAHLEIEAATLLLRTEVVVTPPGGRAIATRFEARLIGPATSSVHMAGDDAESVAIYSYAPRNDGGVDYWITCCVPRSGDDAADARTARASHAYQIATVDQDVPIWENKIHRKQPLLVESERNIVRFRAWYQQFYA